jgi:hypothetical protein
VARHRRTGDGGLDEKEGHSLERVQNPADQPLGLGRQPAGEPGWVGRPR